MGREVPRTLDVVDQAETGLEVVEVSAFAGDHHRRPESHGLDDHRPSAFRRHRRVDHNVRARHDLRHVGAGAGKRNDVLEPVGIHKVREALDVVAVLGTLTSDEAHVKVGAVGPIHVSQGLKDHMLSLPLPDVADHADEHPALGDTEVRAYFRRSPLSDEFELFPVDAIVDHGFTLGSHPLCRPRLCDVLGYGPHSVEPAHQCALHRALDPCPGQRIRIPASRRHDGNARQARPRQPVIASGTRRVVHVDQLDPVVTDEATAAVDGADDGAELGHLPPGLLDPTLRPSHVLPPHGLDVGGLGELGKLIVLIEHHHGLDPRRVEVGDHVQENLG